MIIKAETYASAFSKDVVNILAFLNQELTEKYGVSSSLSLFYNGNTVKFSDNLSNTDKVKEMAKSIFEEE